MNTNRGLINTSYGMAETTVLICTSRGFKFDEETDIVACGDLNQAAKYGVDVVICDPDHLDMPLIDGEVGMIMVQTPSGAIGYVNKRPELTEKTFHNIIAGKDGIYINTGDLGFVRDRTLMITGRIKDLIIINGKNIYPTDLEMELVNLLPTHLRAGCSAAFQYDKDSAVIICEMQPPSKNLKQSTSIG